MISYRILGSAAAAVVLAALLCTFSYGSAQVVVLHTFTGTQDGAWPFGHLTFDNAGNLYGVTFRGGAHDYGVVYELSPSEGGWNFQGLHTFARADGAGPTGPPVFDAQGNLYGTTAFGGAYDCGTIYELTPQPGSWIETTLYSFTCGADGGSPQDGVVIDATGNLYGTTFSAGNATTCVNSGGCGTVFALMPRGGGLWTLKVLHSFKGPDGQNPQAGVTLDAAGNLYGATLGGGKLGWGTVFRLAPSLTGLPNKFRLLHSFRSAGDGNQPAGAIVVDGAGNLFGTALSGGGRDGSANGTVFQLSPVPAGGWKFRVLYTFTADNTGGAEDLALGSQGSLFGSAGVGAGYGGIFELSPSASGSWSYQTIYEFTDPTQGVYPSAVILDSNGNFYGASQEGGAYFEGVVFEVVP